MKTEKNNKLITDFMNVSYELHSNHFDSWDWIMGVVIEINTMEDYRFTVTIGSMDVAIHDNLRNVDIFKSDCDWQCDELFDSVYEAIIAFIKWYNKLNINIRRKEDNNLIANFMGEPKGLELRYDSSWDMLMEVVDDIENMAIPSSDNNYVVDILGSHCLISDNYGDLFEISVNGYTKIDAVHKTIVEFIKKIR